MTSDRASIDKDQAEQTGGGNLFDNSLFSDLLNSFEDVSGQPLWECCVKGNWVCSNWVKDCYVVLFDSNTLKLLITTEGGGRFF